MSICPVFDGRSAPYPTLGLLKVAEMAAQKHGNLVLLLLGGDKEVYLATGQQSVLCWHEQTLRFPAEFGNLTSNTKAMDLLLGSGANAESEVTLVLRRRRAALERDLEGWFDTTLEHATATLIDEALKPASDLRKLCRLWSVRAVCHTIFGTALPDAEMAEGLLQIEEFYTVMNSTADLGTDVPQNLRQTRAFLDRVLRENMAVAQPSDQTMLACLLAVLPDDLGQEARLDHLRPILFGMIDETLSIDGMNLLWALIHLAQSPDLVHTIADEADRSAMPGEHAPIVVPLALSVAKETQRLYPQLPFIQRRVSESIRFGEQSIPAGAAVLFAPWLVHRDEGSWADPTRFDGRRFLAIDTVPLPFCNTPEGREQDRFIQRHVAVAIRSVCISLRFALAPESLPGNLRPILRSILEPRGHVDIRWSSRSVGVKRTKTTFSSQRQDEEEIAW